MLFLLIVEIEMYGVGAVYSVLMLVRLRGSRSCRGRRARRTYKENFARFDVLTAVLVSLQFFLEVTPCRLVDMRGRFRGVRCWKFAGSVSPTRVDFMGPNDRASELI